MGSNLRIDYLSPLPPVRSGISDYSWDLLPHLAEVADVRVLRLPDQPVSEAVEARWKPVPAEEALVEEARAERPRLPLYQMGNNPYHEAVERLAREHPGVLTLHDWVLHHLLSERTLGRGEWLPYREALAGDHGLLGDLAAIPRRWGGYSDASLFSLPAHRSLLRRQRGVLVHNRWAAERIAEDDPEIGVRVVPMAVPLPPEPDEAAGLAFRERWGVPAAAPLLGSFGFQTPIKRTATAIAALARPGLEEAHLVVVGEVSEHSDLEGAAHRAGVAERVHVTGFVGFDELQAAIAAADLCLNLRYPTAGETSASLLRVLAVGRAAVVSDHAQFAELPAEIAVKAPLHAGDDTAEADALASRLAELLARPDGLARLGEAAREHVRCEHDPARAARAVAEACRELARLEPPGDAPFREGRAPSSLTWSDFPGTLEVEPLPVAGAGLPEEPWPPGERRRLILEVANRSQARWLAGRSGPGGVAFEIRLLDEAGQDLLAGRTWLPLPRDLAPGEACRLETAVRRPPGPARLRIEPHVLGGGGFGGLNGAVWEREI